MLKYGLSQIYLAAAEFDKAAETLQEVIAFYPSKAILKTDMGVIHYKAGRYQQALDLLLETRRQKPNNGFTIYNLALTLEKAGRLEEAIKYYEELILLLPDFTRVYFLLGNIKITHGNRGEGYYNLGIYYWYEGDLSSAKHHFIQATKHLPADSKFRDNSVRILEKIAKYQKKG
jgi:predicted Zn-dependent protease